jgi:triphosphoribosyl-dephospho-CoA synthase
MSADLDRPLLSIGVGCAAIADRAVNALRAEALLTPKPALVDRRGRGAHRDLDLVRLLRSAAALRPGFKRMAECACGRTPSRALREELGRIGREAESAMLAATNGSNAHKGAIWILGLLTAARVMSAERRTGAAVAALAAAIARFTDRYAPFAATHGSRVHARYGAAGARGEALAGFPHVIEVGLPALASARRRGVDEECARLDALMAIMAVLEDTCLLHRGGPSALAAAQAGARAVLDSGGSSSVAGRRALLALDRELLERWASPGGCADVLAACLFLDEATLDEATPLAVASLHRTAPHEVASLNEEARLAWNN